MSDHRFDRRRIYDLDYFLRGGIERRKGAWSKHAGVDDPLGRERSRINHSYHLRLEVQRGKKWRGGTERDKTAEGHYIWL